MRKDILDYVSTTKNLQKFVRENPIWYRKLTRNPLVREEIQIEAMNYYQQTIPHKVQKINESLQLASMLVYMYQGMKQAD